MHLLQESLKSDGQLHQYQQCVYICLIAKACICFLQIKNSFIHSISTKQTITSHLKSLTMTYDIENAFVCFLNKGLTSQSVFVILGNKRLQEMMEIMAKERGATLFATDERFKTFF